MKNSVLIISCVFYPEPVVSAKIGENLAEFLTENNHDITVICPKPTRPFGFNFNKELLKFNFEFIHLNSYTHPQSGTFGRLRESISFGKACFKFIKENNKAFDKVYMNTWPIFGQLGVALICKKSNLPYLIHIQDMYPESLTNKLPILIKQISQALLMPIEKYVLNNACGVIVISERMKNLVSTTRKIEPEKISVVINWQDSNDFDNYQNIWPDTKLTFMYLGNIGPVAGLELIITAFAASKIDAKLVIAGSGSKKEECEKLANSFKNADISFINVPEGKVPEVQSTAHVLLLPMIKGAATSSIPSKLPAYMFSARPIIALADVGSDTANAIIQANCGWVGQPGDLEWLEQAFQAISKMDYKELIQKGIFGRKYAEDFFSKEKNLSILAKSILN